MKNTKKKLPMRNLRIRQNDESGKILPATIIIFSLWFQISTNLNFNIPYIAQTNPSLEIFNIIIAEVNKINWTITHLGRISGLNMQWRMFSPVERWNWQMKFVAVYKDKTEALLPLPEQTPRKLWQQYVIDFREGKFHELILRNEKSLSHYANYLCRNHQSQDKLIATIRVDYHWNKILSPQEAKEQGNYLGKIHKEKGKLGEFKCPTP